MDLRQFFVNEGGRPTSPAFKHLSRDATFDDWMARMRDASVGSEAMAEMPGPELEDAALRAWRRGEDPIQFANEFVGGSTDVEQQEEPLEVPKDRSNFSDQFGVEDLSGEMPPDPVLGKGNLSMGGNPASRERAGGDMDNFGDTEPELEQDPDDYDPDEKPEIGRGNQPAGWEYTRSTGFNDDEPRDVRRSGLRNESKKSSTNIAITVEHEDPTCPPVGDDEWSTGGGDKLKSYFASEREQLEEELDDEKINRALGRKSQPQNEATDPKDDKEAQDFIMRLFGSNAPQKSSPDLPKVSRPASFPVPEDEPIEDPEELPGETELPQELDFGDTSPEPGFSAALDEPISEPDEDDVPVRASKAGELPNFDDLGPARDWCSGCGNPFPGGKPHRIDGEGDPWCAACWEEERKARGASKGQSIPDTFGASDFPDYEPETGFGAARRKIDKIDFDEE